MKKRSRSSKKPARAKRPAHKRIAPKKRSVHVKRVSRPKRSLPKRSRPIKKAQVKKSKKSSRIQSKSLGKFPTFRFKKSAPSPKSIVKRPVSVKKSFPAPKKSTSRSSALFKGVALKRVDPFSVGRLLGAMYGIIGLLIGLFFSAVAIFGGGVSSDPRAPRWIIFIFGFAAIILLPLIYGFIGWLNGVIFCVIYNWFARMLGGIKLELK